MVLRQKYLKILSGLLPAGGLSALLALGAAVPAAADPEPAQLQPPAANHARVGDRLAAIREAVGDVAGATAAPAGEQVAWWAWRNGGGGWRNGGGAWRNGGGGWRNGGGAWHNGGWRNGPWSNFWRNF
jgi:rSAM-associated Gly-rich repeat protein